MLHLSGALGVSCCVASSELSMSLSRALTSPSTWKWLKSCQSQGWGGGDTQGFLTVPHFGFTEGTFTSFFPLSLLQTNTNMEMNPGLLLALLEGAHSLEALSQSVLEMLKKLLFLCYHHTDWCGETCTVPRDSSFSCGVLFLQAKLK